MMKSRLGMLAAALVVAGGCGSASAADRAVAPLVNAKGEAVGTATFTESPHGLLIHVALKDLPSGPKGMHLHSVGTCEDAHDGFKASKGHVNPEGKAHGLLNPKGPDAGDLPNIFVHSDGTAEAEFFTTLASLTGAAGRAALLDGDGGALVIHAKRDDHATQPIGGAGERIACGVLQGG